MSWNNGDMPLRVLDHPLAGHLLAELRDRDTPPTQFRATAKKLTTLLAVEATRSLPTRGTTVQTPLVEARAERIANPLAIVPVLRAGLGMVEPFLELFPEVAVGYIGLERHEETAQARSYYSKLPQLSGKTALCLDPMLATGGSAAQAIGFIKMANPISVTMVCVVAAPEGVQKLHSVHPEVEIVTAALDEGLNERFFIVPGLGDFGDRLFATA